MNYDEHDGYDQQAAAAAEFAHGLISEGDYIASPTSDTVDLGFPNGKPRCAFAVNLYRGTELVTTHTMYQGLDPASGKALEVTIDMLRAIGAIDPMADIAAAVQSGHDTARLRGVDPAKRCKARVKHDFYEGTWRLKVSLFGDSFKDKIPTNARAGLASQLSKFAGPAAAPRGTPIAPPRQGYAR